MLTKKWGKEVLFCCILTWDCRIVCFRDISWECVQERKKRSNNRFHLKCRPTSTHAHEQTERRRYDSYQMSRIYASLPRGRGLLVTAKGEKAWLPGCTRLKYSPVVLLWTSSVYTPTKLSALQPDLKASTPRLVCSDIITSVSFRRNYVIEISADNSFSSYHLPKMIFHYIFIVFFFSFFFSPALSPRTIP